MKLVQCEREPGITPGASFGSVVVGMDTTRLTGTIIPAQVLLSDHEAQGIPSAVQEVRGQRNEPLMGIFKDPQGLQDGLHAFQDYRVEDYGKAVNMELAYFKTG